MLVLGVSSMSKLASASLFVPKSEGALGRDVQIVLASDRP